jgi:predicted ArsR family transcriptional regulator
MRLEEVVRVLDNMGAVIELEEREGIILICGYSCPFGAIPQSHPQVCTLMEAMLTSMLAVTVRQQCERGEQLSCRFEVPATAR